MNLKKMTDKELSDERLFIINWAKKNKINLKSTEKFNVNLKKRLNALSLEKLRRISESL
ncbi:hypothetical protein [uncultured Draconibacterium sp.]|uniref:hypothetical protein n=1 Tax=uncultured Draconibacterium sp. TaxID=1573823 RepID=UPI003749E453